MPWGEDSTYTISFPADSYDFTTGYISPVDTLNLTIDYTPRNEDNSRFDYGMLSDEMYEALFRSIYKPFHIDREKEADIPDVSEVEIMDILNN